MASLVPMMMIFPARELAESMASEESTARSVATGVHRSASVADMALGCDDVDRRRRRKREWCDVENERTIAREAARIPRTSVRGKK